MLEPLVVIDSSEIRKGKLEELKSAIRALATFVERNEPRPIAYHGYLREDDGRLTVLQIHPDSASMEIHMELAGSPFPQFAGLIQLSTMDIHGKPSDALLAQLGEKARRLGAAQALGHEIHAGFSRFRAR